MSGKVAVVDYGMGNLRSVWQALAHVAGGREVVVTADPAELRAAERVVFPGQGAMPDCMRELELRGLRQAVLDAARDKPFLGICIGQQMLFEHSAQGDVPGLGVFAGQVVRFRAAHGLERGAPGASTSPVEGHRGRRAVLFRAQLPRCADVTRGRRWRDRLWHSLYQCGSAG